MDKIIEMKNKKLDLIKQQRAMLDKIDAEKRRFTDEEDAEYKRLNGEIDQLEKDILDAEADQERRRKLAEKELEARNAKTVIKVPKDDVADVDPEKEFRNVGEFFFAIARMKSDGVRDNRLEILREKREQTMGTGATGGYALPEQFDATIRQVQAQEAIIRPRATVIPAGSPPDAKLTFPSLDQTSAQNIYGGVTVVHTGEGVTMSSPRPG